MDMTALASLTEALRPKSEGERVNVHVVRHVAIPEPDFARLEIIAAPLPKNHTEIEAPIKQKRRVIPA